MKEVLQFVMEGGAVTRYHTRPGIKPDTDAQHQWGVALMCMLLTDSPSAQLLQAALTHDLAEQATSDMSAPSKRALGLRDLLQKYENSVLDRYGLNYTKDLTQIEMTALALADQLDGLMYCCREMALGSRVVLLVWRRQSAYIDLILGELSASDPLWQRATEVYTAIINIYHEVTSVTGPDFDVFETK